MTEHDPFDDSMFDNTGSGSGLDPYEGQHVLFVPTAFVKDGGKSLKDNTPIDVVDTEIIGFEKEMDPDESTVRIFSGVIVGKLRRAALFNEAVAAGRRDAQESGLPMMVVGTLFKDTQNQKRGQNAAWALKKIEDPAVLSRMRTYAKSKLREKDPFSD